MINRKIDIIPNIIIALNQYGIRAMSMNILAQKNQINIQELYTVAHNKKDLIIAILNYLIEQKKETFNSIRELPNPIDEFVFISKELITEESLLKKQLEFELKKYYQEEFNKYQEELNSLLKTSLTNNIERGKKEAFFRHELNTDITALFYLEKINSLKNTNIHTILDCEIKNVFTTITINELRGLCNIRGVDYVERKKEYLNSIFF